MTEGRMTEGRTIRVGADERRAQRSGSGELAVRRDRLTGLPSEGEFLRVAEETQGIMRSDEIEATLVLLAIESGPSALETLPAITRESLLVSVSAVLSITLRATDTLAHTGAGLFAVLLADTPVAGAQQAIARVTAAMATMPLPDASVTELNLLAGMAPLAADGTLQSACDAAAAGLALRRDEPSTATVPEEAPVADSPEETLPAVSEAATSVVESVSILVADHNVGRQIVASCELHRHGYYDPLLATSRNVTRRRLLAEKPDYLLVALEYAGFGHDLLKEMAFSVGSGKRIIIAAHEQSRPFAKRMVVEGKALGVIDLPYDALTMAREVSRLVGVPEMCGPARDKGRLDVEIRELMGA
jgi:GGDEF domain-containing protein